MRLGGFRDECCRIKGHCLDSEGEELHLLSM